MSLCLAMSQVRATLLLVAASLLCWARGAGAGSSPALTSSASTVLSVESPRGALGAIREAAQALGGKLVHGSELGATVELPSGSTASFFRRLSELGRLRSERFATQDVTGQITDAESRARAARESYQRLERANVTARDMYERIALERELEQVQQAAAAAEAELRELRAREGVTRIEIRFDAPAQSERIEPPILPFEWLQQLELPRLLDPHSPSEVQPRVLRAFADGTLELRVAYAPEPGSVDEPPMFFGRASSFPMLGESSPIGLFGGFDLVLGGGGGFVYGAQSLLGLGLPIGNWLAIGASSGPGIDGVTGGVVPFGLDVPIELFVMLDPVSWMSAAIWVRDGWVLLSEERKHGSERALFGDELSGGVTLGFGEGAGGGYSDDRVGPVVGIAYRELMGTALFELRVGWGARELDFSY
jgi:hypothetical protein